MALIDKKVSEAYSGRDISSLSDRPNEDGLTAQDLKARFDQLGKEVIPKYNQLIDLLVALLEQGNETDGHTHDIDNLNDGVTNRLFTELMRLKLESIAENAEVNQNAFSSIKVGATTGNADSKTATFEIVAGLNIVASIDPLTNKVTLSASGTLATQAVQSIIDDIGNYFTSLEVNGALQEIGASLYPSLSKTTPVDADTILISDSASSGVFKKLSWANIKATLKTYFDAIYQAILVSGTSIKTINGSSILASGDVELLPKNNAIATGTQTFPSIITNGIKFPATQVPSADANTFDDYEEGTTTPTITASSGTFTTVSGTCKYTKIGRMVFINASVTITTAGTAVDNIRFTLPFASGDNSAGVGKEIQATGFQVAVDVGFGASVCEITKYDGTTMIANGRTIRFSLAYSV